MSLRIAIVGPGRVGSALGRRLAQSGVQVLGYVGRHAERTAAAVQAVGMGRALAWTDLAQAHVVLFAVGDADLQAAVTMAVAAAPPRSCSLWLHTSGRHDLGVFAAAVTHGIRRGSLHPVAPFATAPAAAAEAMLGAPAVIDGDARSLRLLHRLCHRLGMVPVLATGGDRVLYHAACALAANGLTALHSLVGQAFAAAGGVAAAEQPRLIEALMAAALRACHGHGAVMALSGPVRRGDLGTVQDHLEALQGLAPGVPAAYRVLMLEAVDLARQAGLAAARAQALRAVLQGPEPRLPS